MSCLHAAIVPLNESHEVPLPSDPLPGPARTHAQVTAAALERLQKQQEWLQAPVVPDMKPEHQLQLDEWRQLMGMLLSLPVLLFGLWLILRAYRKPALP